MKIERSDPVEMMDAISAAIRRTVGKNWRRRKREVRRALRNLAKVAHALS